MVRMEPSFLKNTARCIRIEQSYGLLLSLRVCPSSSFGEYPLFFLPEPVLFPGKFLFELLTRDLVGEELLHQLLDLNL